MRPSIAANEVGWEMLNAQQKMFAEEWVRTHNYTKALTHAGYQFTPNSSSPIGNRLVKRCHRYIKYLEAHALRASHISIEAIQHEYARVGFANPLNYYIRDPKNNRRIRPKKLDELTYDEAAAIKEWGWMMFKNDDGTEELVLTDIKLHPKEVALRDLGKTLGAFPQNPQVPALPPGGQTATAGIDFSKLSSAELRDLDRLMKRAQSAMSSARDAQAITGQGADAAPSSQRTTSGPASSPETRPVPRLPSGITAKDIT